MTPEERSLIQAAANALNSLLAERPAALEPAGYIVPVQTYGQAHPLQPGDWVCPIHGTRKIVPAGVSKKDGRPYQAFVSCETPFCDQRPPRTARNGAQTLSPVSEPTPGQLP